MINAFIGKWNAVMQYNILLGTLTNYKSRSRHGSELREQREYIISVMSRHFFFYLQPQ